jgi:hypothetical protein
VHHGAMRHGAIPSECRLSDLASPGLCGRLHGLARATPDHYEHYVYVIAV